MTGRAHCRSADSLGDCACERMILKKKVPAQRGRGGSLTPHGHGDLVQSACHSILPAKMRTLDVL